MDKVQVVTWVPFTNSLELFIGVESGSFIDKEDVWYYMKLAFDKGLDAGLIQSKSSDIYAVMIVDEGGKRLKQR